LTGLSKSQYTSFTLQVSLSTAVQNSADFSLPSALCSTHRNKPEEKDKHFLKIYNREKRPTAG